MAVSGFRERIERIGSGLLSADFGSGLNGWGADCTSGFRERIERMGSGWLSADFGNGLSGWGADCCQRISGAD